MKILLTTLIAVDIAINVFAQAGKLDSSFGNSGVVTTQCSNCIGFWTLHVVLTHDSKIIAAGTADVSGPLNYDCSLIRYNSDGSLDNTFGNNGIFQSATADADLLESATMQQDGKIVYVGWAWDRGLISRVNVNGTFDSTFGINGTVLDTTLFDANSVVIEPDGKIVVAGHTLKHQRLSIIRYNQDGTRDIKFGSFESTALGMDFFQGKGKLAVQVDGKVVGTVSVSNGWNDEIAVVRYDSNGYPDSTFSDDGIAITSYGGLLEAASVSIQNEKIIIGGYLDNGSDKDFALVRFNPNGNIDSSFGSAGKVITSLGYHDDGISSIAIQTDGKIIAAGNSYVGTQSGMALIRYQSNGTLDSTFNSNSVTVESVQSWNYLGSIVLQPDNNIIAGGTVNGSVGLLRFLSGMTVGALDFSLTHQSAIIYPNPVQQTEILEYTLLNNEAISITLYELFGKLVRNFISNELRSPGTHREVLNMGNLSSGVYFLTIDNGVGRTTIKLVKQ